MTLNLKSPHPGSCHCGAVTFEVTLLDGLNTARRCTCSMCRMRGAIAVSAKMGDFELVTGADVLSTYTFNTEVAQHYFCGRCGIYTHHRRRSNPDLYGVNLACLEGMSPFDLREVQVLDGQNHPRDTGRGPTALVAGTLRYAPAEAG